MAVLSLTRCVSCRSKSLNLFELLLAYLSNECNKTYLITAQKIVVSCLQAVQYYGDFICQYYSRELEALKEPEVAFVKLGNGKRKRGSSNQQRMGLWLVPEFLRKEKERTRT